MSLTQVMPIVMGLLVGVYVVQLSLRSSETLSRNWLLPACVASGFLLWTLAAVIHEGPTGFWSLHTRGLWGNQIWFGLLFAVSVALAFMVPRARSLGMRTAPWALFVLATGSIGLLAMCARIIQLEAREVSAGHVDAGSSERVSSR